MGWGFRVTCPDCHHEWEGIEISARLGPWLIGKASISQPPSREWFCPRCYLRLYLPREIDRSAWRRWHEEFLASVSPPCPFLREVAAKLDAYIDHARLDTPILIDVYPGDCPVCLQPFELSGQAEDSLVCPQCHGRTAVLDGFHSHCSMAAAVFGFD